MNWDESADNEAFRQFFDAIPTAQQTRMVIPFRLGARWMRDQLRTDGATERAAKAMYEDECEQSWDYAAEWVRDTYRPLARTAITALLGDS